MSPAMAMNDERSEDCHAIESEYHKGVKHLYEKGYLHKVPKKYMFPASERPTKSMDDDSNVAKENLQLPIIDFTDLIGPNRLQALESLANACEQYGFFQLVNHNISDDITRSSIDVAGRFFDLPLEERAKYMTTDMRAAVRYGTSFSQTKDSVFCWRDFLKLICNPLPDFVPHWPASPLDFQEVVASYAEKTKHLFLTIMEAILESLGIMEEEAKENDNNNNNNNIMKELDNGSQMLVTNFYPPCPEPDLTLGMHPHSDYGFLTLLLQDEVEGLQIQYQDKWLTVQPIPNAFVVNIGDHLEIFSNGKYKSVLHRVLVNKAKSRVSVASLHSLPFDCTVRPSPKLIDEENPKRYMDTDFASFLAYVSTRETKKKDFLESRKLPYT
ncbi:putative flavanone 3-dioxygenase [Medicago truncatula]|uniref:Leucoanthocyanidin dioxygenase-like protein n=1 Tax=Medicago truncatula TaxID=3880 RepID=G7L4Z8_MEDTR|nr:probable 2-oxoglutarate-dependent dioxygenase SLC1 [Medicago truncatula]XP_024625650.1 probable 2-oxoglutarate-dependent dioxygenase SLC1 [Medicago truncatula]AES81965.2 leucoanthocyanidin dioxygenase-like protein [Medicago truncatula]RHN48574.1 putative flavanone 3-dioxygenase [Medicago truncatula]